jgi:hypothetical protein
MMPSPQGGSVSERPPNLFNPRRITSTAEIDSLFWHTDRADTILAIKGKWKLQESGFLCCPTHTGDSETMILGARWQQAGVVHEAIAPEIASNETPPPQASEIAVEQGRVESAPAPPPKAETRAPLKRPRPAWGGKYDALTAPERKDAPP